MVGAFIDDTLAGYSVADRHTGNLTQIAVRREYRRRGVGSLLLRETIKGMATDFYQGVERKLDRLPPACISGKPQYSAVGQTVGNEAENLTVPQCNGNRTRGCLTWLGNLSLFGE